MLSTPPGGYQLMRAIAPLAGTGGASIFVMQKSPWLNASLAGTGGMADVNATQRLAGSVLFRGGQ